MAKVFYVRDGYGEDRASRGREIEPGKIIEKFPRLKPKFSKDPPCLNPQTVANPYADYRYVVLQIEISEVSEKFLTPGYWILDGMTPREFGNVFPS